MKTNKKTIKEKKTKYFRCPSCDKLIIFKDEVTKHCYGEHGHSSEYLKGVKDTKELILNRVSE